MPFSIRNLVRTRAGRVLAATTTIAVGGSVAVVATSGSGSAEPADLPSGIAAIGLTTDNRLTSFDVAAAGKSTVIGQVTGLVGDTKVAGIDYRVQDGELYGVGDQGGIYTLDATTAVAVKVSQLSVALQGNSLGVDFNPAADRLRVITGQGQNLRHDLNTDTTTVDGSLNYPVPPEPAIPGKAVTAAAYTNNDLDTNSATTLFVIDTRNDQVAIQSPANSGQLAATGKLRADAPAATGFDIRTSFSDGRAITNLPIAVFRADGRSHVHSVNFITGEAKRQGTFPKGQQVVDVALSLDD